VGEKVGSFEGLEVGGEDGHVGFASTVGSKLGVEVGTELGAGVGLPTE